MYAEARPDPFASAMALTEPFGDGHKKRGILNLFRKIKERHQQFVNHLKNKKWGSTTLPPSSSTSTSLPDSTDSTTTTAATTSSTTTSTTAATTTTEAPTTTAAAEPATWFDGEHIWFHAITNWLSLPEDVDHNNVSIQMNKI